MDAYSLGCVVLGEEARAPASDARAVDRLYQFFNTRVPVPVAWGAIGAAALIVVGMWLKARR